MINPGNPTQIFEGSDGGVIRTNGSFSDISSQCDSPFRNGGGPLPSTSGSYLTCKRVLSRVPTELSHIDSKLSSTLQFINVAVNPGNPCQVLGGTQDNGTWSNLSQCNNNTFNQVIYGDGGNAVFDASQPTWMANEFTSAFGDSNFENGDPTKWVIATAPIVNSHEAVGFYWPQIGDPNPLAGHAPDLQRCAARLAHLGVRRRHAWPRTAGHDPRHLGLRDELSRVRDLGRAARPAATTGRSAARSARSAVTCTNAPGDLTGTAYGSDRSGGSISWIARTSQDHGTLWAATGAGRIFVTHNADALDPATVSWHRIDSSTTGSSPTRYPSAIYVDPNNPSHAWVSYSGYNAVTPTTPATSSA